MPYTPKSDYPYVAKASDPLVVRVSECSLLVGNSHFYAKIKTGIEYKGYMIYVSGIPTPIMEKKFSDSNKIGTNGVKVQSWTASTISNEAKLWLDKLEIALAENASSDTVTKSIDTLCWQLHYDMTKTTGSPPSYFDNTIATSIDKTNTLKDYNEDVVDSITVMDENFNDSTDGTLIALKTSTEKVATNIKADNDTYTISKALRDSTTSDDSVAHSVKDQTTTISNSFSDVEGRIGQSTDSASAATLNGKLKKIDTLIGASGDTGTSTLFGYSNTINSNVGSGGSSISSVATTVNNIATRLGSNSSTSGTVWYDILHNAGTKQKGVVVESDSPIAWTRDKILEKVGDASTSNTLWYDVLHNPGTKENTAGYETDSVVDKIISAVS